MPIKPTHESKKFLDKMGLYYKIVDPRNPCSFKYHRETGPTLYYVYKDAYKNSIYKNIYILKWLLLEHEYFRLYQELPSSRK